MNNYFWTYQTNLPPDVGYKQFSPPHLIIISIIVIMSFFYINIYMKGNVQIRRRISLVTAILLPGLIAVRTVYALIQNVPIIYELPLHLCSMTGILIPIHYITRGRLHRILSQVLYSLCLPGAACAIIFPDGTMYPPVSFISLESYTFHFLIIVYVISQVAVRKIRPRLRDCYQSFLFIIVVSPFVYLFDRINRLNYMFLMWPVPGSPLEWFEHRLGNPGYLWGYGLLAVAVIVLMNLPFSLISSKGRFLHFRKN